MGINERDIYRAKVEEQDLELAKKVAEILLLNQEILSLRAELLRMRETVNCEWEAAS